MKYIKALFCLNLVSDYNPDFDILIVRCLSQAYKVSVDRLWIAFQHMVNVQVQTKGIPNIYFSLDRTIKMFL